MRFFFNDTATTESYTYVHTLSLHDALPIWGEVVTARDLPIRRRPEIGIILVPNGGVDLELFNRCQRKVAVHGIVVAPMAAGRRGTEARERLRSGLVIGRQLALDDVICVLAILAAKRQCRDVGDVADRKSTRLNSS